MGGCSWCRVGLGNPYSTRCVTALPHFRIVLSRPASSPHFGEGIVFRLLLVSQRQNDLVAVDLVSLRPSRVRDRRHCSNTRWISAHSLGYEQSSPTSSQSSSS